MSSLSRPVSHDYVFSRVGVGGLAPPKQRSVCPYHKDGWIWGINKLCLLTLLPWQKAHPACFLSPNFTHPLLTINTFVFSPYLSSTTVAKSMWGRHDCVKLNPRLQPSAAYGVGSTSPRAGIPCQPQLHVGSIWDEEGFFFLF